MSAQLLQSNNATYVCDTLPAPRLASDKPCSRSPSPSPSSPPQVTTFDAPILDPAQTQVSSRPHAPSLQSVQATPPRPPLPPLSARMRRASLPPPRASSASATSVWPTRERI
ncbi:hypothetical protein NUW54_g2269 [Trametes sanguinea]|uniref:Uncharacterized protein n=1 Tax=Trametes sanguinea TaxID=158606 RepID=A0ACC1Q418_9APHY|nr:hypothetical protein NUW54_g2269 [Trametes sanguinea]